MAEAVDGLELREVLRVSENDAAKSGRGEDEEERKIEFFGFGFAPFAEAFVEGLLLGGEIVGWFGCASASEGLGLSFAGVD